MKVCTVALLLGSAAAFPSPDEPMEKAEKMMSMSSMSQMSHMSMGMDDHMMGMGSGDECMELPEIGELIKRAFPEDVDGGIWNSNYLTKKWNGMDPALGGYPTPIDTRYPFEAVAPWLGQPGGGTPHHCADNMPADTQANDCPKLIVNSDNGPFGPGHTPPHIALRAVSDTHCEAEDWFDYENWGCDIPHDILLGLIRRFYPRDPDTGAVDYPPPDTEGTPEYYPYEFPGNRGPHWCTQEVMDAGIYGDYCPYEPEGRYRHPHLALAALNVYLANMYMPEQCGTEWMDQLPEGVTYPPQGWDTGISFPAMEDEDDPNSQPAVPYQWPGPLGLHKQGVPGLFGLSLIVTDDNGDLAPM